MWNKSTGENESKICNNLGNQDNPGSKILSIYGLLISLLLFFIFCPPSYSNKPLKNICALRYFPLTSPDPLSMLCRSERATISLEPLTVVWLRHLGTILILKAHWQQTKSLLDGSCGSIAVHHFTGAREVVVIQANNFASRCTDILQDELLQVIIMTRV